MCCSDVGYDEKSVSLIRRIDFAWAVEREEPSKKQKKESAPSAKEETTTNRQSWEWQNISENLQLAHQELRVIIDLIETVKCLLFANLSILNSVSLLLSSSLLPYFTIQICNSIQPIWEAVFFSLFIVRCVCCIQVEANDAVTVAVNTQKQLTNEILTDLAVSTATKLQCYRVQYCLLRRTLIV